MSSNIRNFSIIAHIDHGKSTLADRMLEMTGTIEARNMKEQVLDKMDLERERGITIKMTPVRMVYYPRRLSQENTQIKMEVDNLRSSSEHERKSAQVEDYILNLIDTPGHVDFAYEVSRALSAVEGVILLVDSTQGVEAQTLSVLSVAKSLGLVIIPVVSKIDSPNARVGDITSELALLLGRPESEILHASGKTGEGVEGILKAVIERIPPPKSSGDKLQALVFDFGYSDHRGVIVYARVFGGKVAKGDGLRLVAAHADFTALEVGILRPSETPTDVLSEGEIGYIVTGIKKPGLASVGDTVTSARNPAPALSGYRSPAPVIWASGYPENQNNLVLLS